jgi:hypothetical protein
MMGTPRRRLLEGAAAACALGALGAWSGPALAQSYKLQTPTALGPTPDTWSFQVFSNGDLVGIQRQGSKGKTEVHVLTASSNFQRFALQTETALASSDDSWEFVALANRDLMAVRRGGASGKTEVHVLDAERDYRAFRLQVPTALPPTDRRWSFGANAEGDLVCINRLSNIGQTEVFVLDARSRYAKVALQMHTALHATDTTWDFGVMPNGDVVAINRGGDSKRSEVHVLAVEKRYGAFRLQVPSPLPAVDKNWKFALRPNGEVYAVLTSGGSSGKTEVHIFQGAVP